MGGTGHQGALEEEITAKAGPGPDVLLNTLSVLQGNSHIAVSTGGRKVGAG